MASRSPVFDHFLQPSESSSSTGIVKVKCKHCDREVSTKGKSTSNLITHLKVKTSIKYFILNLYRINF